MSFVNLFTRRLPIASMKLVDREFGMRDHAWSGTPRVNARARKRVWDFQTPPMSGSDAVVMSKVLRGEWCIGVPFDTARNVYTSKGVAPTVTSTSGGIESGVAADGAPIYVRDVANNVDRKINQYQTGVGFASRATANILTANQSNVDTDTTGFTAVGGATLARRTGAGQFMLGTGGLECVTDAVGGVRGGFYAEVTATDSFGAASVHLRAASGSPVVRVVFENVSLGASVSVTSITLATDRWIKVPVDNLSVSAGNTLRLRVEEETIDSAITFYADCLQVQHTQRSTVWMVGGSSDHGGKLHYPISLINKASAPARGMTIGFWMLPFSPGGVQTGTMFEFLGTGSDDYVRGKYIAGTSFTVECRGTANASAVYSSASFGRQWQHIVISLDYDSNLLRLFEAGVQRQTAALASNQKPDLSKLTQIVLGGNNAASLFADAYIADFFFLPFGISDASELYTYAQVGQLSLFPQLLLSGDVLGSTGDSRIKVVGDCEDHSFLPHVRSGAFDNTARSISGRFFEV